MPRVLRGWPWDDGDGKSEDRSDFRPVPESDKGNKGYRDTGMLGSYQSEAEQFPDPAGVRHFTGYGADEADIARGFCEPKITDRAAYNLENYKYRSSEPMENNQDEGLGGLPEDFDFRQRNRRSRGFLIRPRTPTDR